MSNTQSVPPTPPTDAPLHARDLAFLDALRSVGLLPDLAGEELTRVVRAARSSGGRDGSTKLRMDLLEVHYAGSGDERIAKSRRQVDRFFVHHEDAPATASVLLDRLAAVAPEVGPIALERIGGADGTLVLRAGEDFVALDDSDDEEAASAPTPMVTVRGLVRGVNVLLARRNVRERLVPLRSDVDREVYVAVPLTEAIELARGGHLEEENAEAVMELGSW